MREYTKETKSPKKQKKTPPHQTVENKINLVFSLMILSSNYIKTLANQIPKLLGKNINVELQEKKNMFSIFTIF
jgi:hypothetical protein